MLHPVRLRIVQAFLGDRALTTSQLRCELPDIPPASLYRHVARLVDAAVLAVVAERRVRGALERTYVLRTSAATVSLDELATMSAEDHRQAFLAFVAALIGDFDRYLAKGEIDLLRDGVSYRLIGLWLTDTELVELGRDLFAVLQHAWPTPLRAPGSGASWQPYCYQARIHRNNLPAGHPCHPIAPCLAPSLTDCDRPRYASFIEVMTEHSQEIGPRLPVFRARQPG